MSTSGNAALTTLFPAPRALPLAGRTVFVGKLKLRQKAELQHWLDALPEPNDRVRNHIRSSEKGPQGWPLSVEEMPYLLDCDPAALLKFLQVAIAAFNPGMSQEEIEELASDAQDQGEIVDIVMAAYGQKQKTAESADPKAGKVDAAALATQ